MAQIWWMNVSLTPQLEQWVQDKVGSGMYSSSSDVIRAALRLLHDYEDARNNKMEVLRSELQVGLEQFKAGDYEELTPALMDRIKQKGRREISGQEA